MRNTKVKHLVYLALLSAMAITLSIVESVFIGPLFLGVLKIGLANIIALLTIRLLGVKDMIIVNVMRVMISNLMLGTIFGPSFWISCGGVLLSSLVLIILDKLKSSLLFTSVLSAIAHSCGQTVIVMLFYRQPGIAVLLPYLLLGSIPMGLITGMIARLVLKHIKPMRIVPED
jgi:heptaprenyl diphosphate synthase